MPEELFEPADSMTRMEEEMCEMKKLDHQPKHIDFLQNKNDH
jgi:hypothetical protein